MGRRSKLKWDTPVGQATGPGPRQIPVHAHPHTQTDLLCQPNSPHSIQSVSWPASRSIAFGASHSSCRWPIRFGGTSICRFPRPDGEPDTNGASPSNRASFFNSFIHSMRFEVPMRLRCHGCPTQPGRGHSCSFPPLFCQPGTPIQVSPGPVPESLDARKGPQHLPTHQMNAANNSSRCLKVARPAFPKHSCIVIKYLTLPSSSTPHSRVWVCSCLSKALASKPR